MEIKDLKVNQGQVEIIATVKSVSEPRTIDKFGRELKVATATIADESGEIPLSLWNEDVDKVKAGDQIQITNGYVGEWQNQPQLTTGKFGKLEILESGEGKPATAESAEAPQQAEAETSTESSDEAEPKQDIQEEDVF